MSLLFDADLKRLYARALISVARADGKIGAEEGERLRVRVEERSQLPLADLMLEHSVLPDELVTAVAGGPFRGAAVRGDELGRLLVADGLYVALGKGHVTAEAARRLWRYAMALGLSSEEFRTLTQRWIP